MKKYIKDFVKNYVSTKCNKYLEKTMNNQKQRKKLYCDIDSTINNHWERIHRWSNNGICNWEKALSRDEIMKDEVLPGVIEKLTKLSEEYEIHFLTARNFVDAYNYVSEANKYVGQERFNSAILRSLKDYVFVFKEKQEASNAHTLSLGSAFGAVFSDQ